MSTPAMVPMFSPDGTLGEIPQERMNDAIKAGGRVAVDMIAPDGSRGYVPNDKVSAAIRAGGKPFANTQVTQFEKDRPGASMSIPQQVMDFIKTTASNLIPKGGAPTPYSTMGAVNPAPFQKMQQGEAQALTEQRQFRKDAGYNPIYRAVAEVAPIAMVNPAGAEQAATQARTGAVLGNTVGPTAAVAATGAVMKGANVAANALAASPEDSLIAAIKPGKKLAPKLQTAIDTAKPDLENIAQSSQVPQNLNDLHGSLQKVSLGYEKRFQDLLKPNENVTVSTDPIADRVQAVIDKRPEMAQSLKPIVDKYRGKTMTMGELNARRPDVAGVENAGIRDLLYKSLETLNPTDDVAGLRRSQSAVLTIQNAVQDRANALIAPDAAVKARPLSQKVINTAAGMHVTRPATIPLQVWRLISDKLPSDIPNAQVGSAMSKLRK